MGNAAHSHLLPSGILVGIEGEDENSQLPENVDIDDMYETDLFILPSGRRIISMDTVETGSFYSEMQQDELKPCWSDMTEGTKHTSDNALKRLICMFPSTTRKVEVADNWSVTQDVNSLIDSSFDTLSTRGSTIEKELIKKSGYPDANQQNHMKRQSQIMQQNETMRLNKNKRLLAIYGDKKIDGSGFLDSYYNK
mmetsp:Transcript_49327/g.96478  ORF Transcript_49327/g.96478 Transcript_49327/m.96478 type:complete len:195 (+) Transcript_49327:375-959(+)